MKDSNKFIKNQISGIKDNRNNKNQDIFIPKCNLDFKDIVIPKNLESMRKFAETYAKRTNTFFCIDSSITAVVINGLAKYKDKYGAPLCPCRNYENIEAEVQSAYWNCPCVPMRERKECHCTLFLMPENDYSSKIQDIDMETIVSHL
ncbi:unnamed protein product [Discosporangium mesarthrocarpum]